MRLNWIVDIDILDKRHHSALRALKNLGHNVTRLSVLTEPKFITGDDVLYPYIGSFEGIHDALNRIQQQLILSGTDHRVSQHHYVSNIPVNWLLNNQSFMTTWAYLYNNSNWHFGAVPQIGPTRRIFVRPDNGNKSFSGMILNEETIQQDMDYYKSIKDIDPATMIWFAPVQDIGQEYRVWISKKEVITWSKYGKIFEEENYIPGNIIKLASEVAEFNWQVDSAYVADFTTVNNQAKLVEFNSFSCSDLYECDSTALLTTISNDILKDWE